MPLLGGAPGGVDYLVAVAKVPLERLLEHEQLLALLPHQDLAMGLEDALPGALRRELDLLVGLGGTQTGGPLGRDGGHEHVEALVVVDGVALVGADHYGVLLAVVGVYLVGAGAAVEGVVAGAARYQVVAVAAA